MMQPKYLLLAVALAAAAFALGRCSADPDGGRAAPTGAHDHEVADAGAAQQPAVWTCPMHAQIRLPDPGSCPICGMDLVPQSDAGGDDDPRRLVMSASAQELARIAVEPVRRESVTRPVRMVGKVDFDETAVKTISAWVAGRLDRLFVDYTGVRVQRGDHLVRLFSPDLLTAQEELLSARERMASTAGEASPFLSDSNRRAYASAREKLVLWGLSEEQVDEIEARGTADDHVILTSPSTGVVIDKLLDEGAYVQTGSHVYRIADLSHLWVRLDAYEQDLAWLRHGQEVTIQVEALPGESIVGRVSYIDPIVDEHTRTAKVRVNVDNTDGRLKPGMFVRAVASARIGAGGRVADQYLVGKWVSPMHPEIVKDGPGACDICGMDLVPAEELGIVSAAPSSGELPLTVPRSAVLLTGKRAVVYVEVQDAERPTYEGREVLLGPRAGERYVVLSGLAEGERVVTNGAFRIDSSMQIRARPSMLSMPSEQARDVGPEAAAFAALLRPVFEGYLALQRGLAADAATGVGEELDRLRAAVAMADESGPPDPRVERRLHEMHAALLEVGDGADIERLRETFHALSNALIAIEEAVGNPLESPLRVVHCPMAFDNTGADWLQVEEDVANPYFGDAMLRCGSVVRVAPTRGGL